MAGENLLSLDDSVEHGFVDHLDHVSLSRSEEEFGGLRFDHHYLPAGMIIAGSHTKGYDQVVADGPPASLRRPG
ncbi:hypothetical protein VA596_37125 [Amycolatopsis sp., V23-08]|uniref:Uncharacterized protein n=1 Tax=Amycolatopsis heterodermiae TaxID=3110235 RepID=A0ABU5RG02_9PSEU|nr:hypothetical protein [Amycolatopsis sp., V23-08]MEA5365203.1 hypothetical protein [Amycolatopsis sp., V23-08]